MDKITELLEKRDKDRRAKLEELQELRNKENAASEGIDYFEGTFNEKVREIQNNLTNLESGDINLPQTFSKIGTSLQELQRYLSNSTFFLNDRKVKNCQETLNELGTRLEEKKSKLIPKKKFGFRNKTLTVQKSPSNPNNINLDELDNSDTKKKLFQYTASDKSNKMIIIKDTDAHNQDITVANLTTCLLQIKGHPGSIHLKNINNCLILSGPVSRSIFAENCKSSTFVIACQQLRLHSSTNCNIYLHVTSRGIIEDSNQIHVSSYNWAYDGIESDFQASRLLKDKNNWNDLADFNWLSAEQQSPNWSIIQSDKVIQDWDKFIRDWNETNSVK